MQLWMMALVCAYIAWNFAVAEVFSAKEMKRRFITGQNYIGIFLTNLFYLPAWILKTVELLCWRKNP